MAGFGGAVATRPSAGVLLLLLVSAAACLGGTGKRKPALPGAAVSRDTAASTSSLPPPGYARGTTSYEWCDCGTGLASVDVSVNSSAPVRVLTDNTTWVRFEDPTSTVSWTCSASASAHDTVPYRGKLSPPREVVPTDVWGVQLTRENKPFPCGKPTGRLRFNSWDAITANDTALATSVPFVSQQAGYACVKIPSLLRTTRGTLIAFAEARRANCSDFARTDLLFRRSLDGGATWSAFGVLATPPAGTPGSGGLCGNPLVVGNAAPVQLSAAASTHPGRILVPHMHNNFEVWSVHSDDDGATWSEPRHVSNASMVSQSGPDCTRNMSYFGIGTTTSILDWIRDLGWGTFNPYVKWREQLSGPWQFVGIGPPGSIALRSRPDRVIVPGFHSFIRGLAATTGRGAGVGLPVSQLYNNLALGHVLISDDGGDTYRIESAAGFGDNADGHGANENQMVELQNGSILANSRSLATGTPQFRVQARSDDGGETFLASRFVRSLPEPFDGCEGSIVSTNNGSVLYFAHPNPVPNTGIASKILQDLAGKANLTGRDHMTLWRSTDQGATYTEWAVIDPGAAGYVSLQVDETEGVIWAL